MRTDFFSIHFGKNGLNSKSSKKTDTGMQKKKYPIFPVKVPSFHKPVKIVFVYKCQITLLHRKAL